MYVRVAYRGSVWDPDTLSHWHCAKALYKKFFSLVNQGYRLLLKNCLRAEYRFLPDIGLSLQMVAVVNGFFRQIDRHRRVCELTINAPELHARKVSINFCSTSKNLDDCSIAV